MAKTISTDRGAQTAKPDGSGKRLDLGVKDAPGLRLRVTPSQRGNVSKIWSFLYTRKSDGKKCRITLGEYPAMSLAEAVTRAGKYRNEVRDGADPAQTRYDEKHAMTFEKLAYRWLERHAKPSRKSWRECERMLNKEVLKALGGKKAEAVSKKDVIACADAVLDRGAPVLANRVLSLIGSIYAWGMSEDLVERNPAAGVRKRAAEASREHKMRPAEIRRFWQGLGNASLSRNTADVLRLALLLGQRGNEIAGARKAEFDLVRSLWEIPAARTKNGQPHRLPLPPKAVQILGAAFERSPHSGFVFPSLTKGTDAPVARTTTSTVWIRARKALGLDDVTVHDLRRTFASLAGDLNFNDFEIGLVLNHAGGRSKVTTIYNRAQYDAPKRRILEAVERRLFEIIEDREPAENIVPIRSQG